MCCRRVTEGLAFGKPSDPKNRTVTVTILVIVASQGGTVPRHMDIYQLAKTFSMVVRDGANPGATAPGGMFGVETCG